MKLFCHQCGAPLSEGARFCPKCGAGIQTAVNSQPTSQTRQSVNEHPAGVKALVVDAVRETKASIMDYVHHPQKMVPMLVLAGIWLVMALLPALGINPWPVKLVSFMTFAQGGMYGGFWGVVGGVIGKAVFAYFVSVLVLPVVIGKASLKSLGEGYRRLLAGFSIHGLNVLAPLLLGIGIALIAFNFQSGNASLVNSMPGLVGFVLALRALSRQSGLIWNMLLSGASKLSKGRIPSGTTIQRLVSGFAAGGLAGVGLSVLRLPYLPYWLGLVAIVAGVVLGLTVKAGKEAVSA